MAGSESDTGSDGDSSPSGTRGTVTHVDSRADLERTVVNEDVVLVYFSADWCGPCRLMRPVIEAIVDETPVTVAKVDVDEHGDLEREYDVRGVPTFLLFASGELVERRLGAQGKSKLSPLIERHR